MNHTNPTTPASGDELSDEQHGELDPHMAYETAQRMLRYVDAFNSQEWVLSTFGGNVDRKNLGVALDNLQECAAMLLNQSDRLRSALAADRAARPATGVPAGYSDSVRWWAQSCDATKQPETVGAMLREYANLLDGLRPNGEDREDWKQRATTAEAQILTFAVQAEADATRLDYMVDAGGFIVWTNRDGSIRQCQVWTQDEDEVFHQPAGEHRFFNSPRSAIDAAIQSDAARVAGGEEQK